MHMCYLLLLSEWLHVSQRNLNGLENGFEIALSIAENILLGVFDTAISTIKGETEWDNTFVISDTVIFQ